MEMPIDVINRHVGNLKRNHNLTGVPGLTVSTMLDQELQAKFTFFPQEEIAAVEIDGTNALDPKAGNFDYSAGSGPETISANENDNPAWYYNAALHALAMYQHLKKVQSPEYIAEQKKLAMRPEPGVYLAKARTTGGERFTVIVTADRRVLVPASLEYENRLHDHTEGWDERYRHHWQLERIDITDGTVQA